MALAYTTTYNYFMEMKTMAKPQTITQKILAAHCGKDYVEPGELILAKVDIALGNDITAPLAIKDFHKVGAKQVFDRERVVLVCDHFAPNKDIPSAIQCQQLRNFAKEQDLTHFYDGGEMGVEHALLPEKGIVGPGDVIIGADSHTCTYGALGAFATGVGSTDLAAAMVHGECWFRVPDSIRLVYNGKLPQWITGKDLILHTIGDIGVDGARYMAMEFTGEAITPCPWRIAFPWPIWRWRPGPKTASSPRMKPPWSMSKVAPCGRMPCMRATRRPRISLKRPMMSATWNPRWPVRLRPAMSCRSPR